MACGINNIEISKCIRNMNNGKTAGPDGLVAEHIRMAEPVIIYLLYIDVSILTIENSPYNL